MAAVAAPGAAAIIEVRRWAEAWLCLGTGLLIAGQILKIPPQVQFWIAVPLAIIAGGVCLVLIVEK